MLVILCFCLALWFNSDFLFPLLHPVLENQALLLRLLSLGQIILFSALSIPVTNSINRTAAYYAKRRPHAWIPLASASGFIIIVGVVHYAAWVPPSLGAVIASPLLFLPPLSYFVKQRTTLPQPVQPLFSVEEICKVKDNVQISGRLREFLERYPNSHAYIYKKELPHTTGGLFLHNRERFPIPRRTYLDVTLDCPFTTKAGEFALGRETFHAYFSRPHKNGDVIQPLPQKSWEDWLAGQTTKQWMDHIKELDDISPSFPPMNNLPYQLHTKFTTWQTFSLL